MHAAIFDMDGVIVDTNPHHRIAWRNYYARYGKPLSDADFVQYVSGRHNDAILAHLFAGQPLSADDARRLAYEKEALFRELYRPVMQPVPGLVPFLESLRAAGIRTAVATSAPVENLNFVVDALGLRPYFDVLLDESQVSRPKPDPEIYRKAMTLLAVAPTDSVVFEDSVTGIRAAKAAGAYVIGVATTESFDTLRPLVDDIIPDFAMMNPARLLRLVNDF